jgi:hypothetical protein
MSEEPSETSPLIASLQPESYSINEGDASVQSTIDFTRSETRKRKNGGNGLSVPASEAKKKKKKKKDKGVLLNYDSAMELEYQVQINLIKHNLASQYYGARHFWFFVIPQGLLTMIASVLAFITTSALISDVTKTIIGTVVGSTSGIVVFLQTMGGVCDYGTKSAMHASAAIDLRDLRDELVLIKFKVKKEEEQEVKKKKTTNGTEQASGNDDNYSYVTSEAGSVKGRKSVKTHFEAPCDFEAKDDDDGNSDSDSEDEEERKEEEKKIEEHGNTFERIQQRYRQSLSGCKSNVPMPLSEAFHGLHSNLLVSESLDNNMYMREIYGPKVNYKNIIHFKAYDILASEILNSFMFPVRLPNSKKAVDYAMNHLNEELNRYHKYWDNKLDKLKENNLEEQAWEDAHPGLNPNLRNSMAFKSLGLV